MIARLVAFEGIDGCGKTTQIHALSSKANPQEVVTTAEPGGTALGSELRRLVLDPGIAGISEVAEALLLAADRAEHVHEVIEPALRSGRWVLTDRYSGSTLAYQGYGRGLDLEILESVVFFATGGIDADLNVLIEVSPDVARLRLRSSSPDRLERLSEDFHRRVSEGYSSLANRDPARWVVIDGAGDVDEVSEQVLQAVESRLGPSPFAGVQSANTNTDTNADAER